MVPQNSKCQYARKDLNIWGELLTKLALFRQTFFTDNSVDESIAEDTLMSNKANRTLCFRVEQLLVDAIKLMPEGFPIGELKLFFMSNYGVDNPSKLNFADFKILFEKAE